MKYYIINITDEYYGCEFISSVLAIGNDKTINEKANKIIGTVDFKNLVDIKNSDDIIKYVFLNKKDDLVKKLTIGGKNIMTYNNKQYDYMCSYILKNTSGHLQVAKEQTNPEANLVNILSLWVSKSNNFSFKNSSYATDYFFTFISKDKYDMKIIQNVSPTNIDNTSYSLGVYKSFPIIHSKIKQYGIINTDKQPNITELKEDAVKIIASLRKK